MTENDGSGVKPELFSPEFYAQFGELNDHVTWNLFYKLGLLIKDDGSFKFKRPIFKAVLEDALDAYHNDIINIEKLREFAEGLLSEKLTRYSMEVEMAKIRREAKK